MNLLSRIWLWLCPGVAPKNLRVIMADVGSRNALDKLEIEVATEIAAKRKKKQRFPGNTRIAADVRAGKRKPPPVPKNKAVSEIIEMDPDDPAFKHPEGRKRTTAEGDSTHWRDMVSRDRQRRANERRARIRKYEATVVAAERTLEDPVTKEHTKLGIYNEDAAIAEGILTLDDWDDEELIRGYRRARNGKFGPPPRFVPREIQNEIFRRLVARGDRVMRAGYLASTQNLVYLAENASSEKVKLEAIKELQNRVVGKVPDRIHVATEQPYESMLADALVPVSEVPPLEMELDEDGVAKLPYLDNMDPLDDGDGGVAATPDTPHDAAREPRTGSSAPPPSSPVVVDLPVDTDMEEDPPPHPKPKITNGAKRPAPAQRRRKPTRKLKEPLKMRKAQPSAVKSQETK